MKDIWRLLQDAGVDVVLGGHDHLYERFAPQNADGAPDPKGMREFIVGTGGAMLYRFVNKAPNSEKQIAAYGVLKLTLKDGGYEYEFIPVTRSAADSDSGFDVCH